MTLANHHNFCMAFLDAKLPDIDGLELARQLRKPIPACPLSLFPATFTRMT